MQLQAACELRQLDTVDISLGHACHTEDAGEALSFGNNHTQARTWWLACQAQRQHVGWCLYCVCCILHCLSCLSLREYKSVRIHKRNPESKRQSEGAAALATKYKLCDTFHMLLTCMQSCVDTQTMKSCMSAATHSCIRPMGTPQATPCCAC